MVDGVHSLRSPSSNSMPPFAIFFSHSRWKRCGNLRALSSNSSAVATAAMNITSTATEIHRTSPNPGIAMTARNRNTVAISTSNIMTVAAELRPTCTRRDADNTQFCEKSPSGSVTVSSPTANASQNGRGGMHTSILRSIKRSCTALHPR